MRLLSVLFVGCFAACRALAAAPPESAGDLLKDIDAQTQELRTAKPAERPALAERLVHDHVQLSELLLVQGKFPAALDALRKAKGLTINLLPARAQELSGQLDVRMTLAQWRQANDGRGLHAEYFKGKEFGEKLAERTDYRIDFLWDRAAPVEGLTGEAFSARWTGFIVAPRPGTGTWSRSTTIAAASGSMTCR